MEDSFHSSVWWCAPGAERLTEGGCGLKTPEEVVEEGNEELAWYGGLLLLVEDGNAAPCRCASLSSSSRW